MKLLYITMALAMLFLFSSQDVDAGCPPKGEESCKESYKCRWEPRFKVNKCQAVGDESMIKISEVFDQLRKW